MFAGAGAMGLTMMVADCAYAQTFGPWGDGNDYGNGWQDSKPQPRMLAPKYDYGQESFPPVMDGGPRPVIEPMLPEFVSFSNTEPVGTIVIDTEARRLYFTLSADEALQYPISVGREGFTWTGTETISRIEEWPDWYPPSEMRVRDPRLPEKMLGGLRNPLGAVAIFLGNSLYRIHGTNDAKTIGLAASSGCFRMLNQHVVHLASLVKVGTTVKVLPRLDVPNAKEELPWLQHAVNSGSPKRGWHLKTQPVVGLSAERKSP